MRSKLLLLASCCLSWLFMAAAPPERTVLVIHGGAGVLTEKEMKAEGVQRGDFERELAAALRAGFKAMHQESKTSVDGVEAAIRFMEDSPLFNAGRGAVFNHDGRVELDASIMQGLTSGSGEGKLDPRKRAGAVAGVSHINNPISAARAVMEMPGSRHVLLIGQDAEWFALSEENQKRYQINRVSNVYFWTERRLKKIQEEVAKEQGKSRGTPAGGADQRRRQPPEAGLDANQKFGTVGAVALKKGNLAAGTSTGGLTNKLAGRVGDSALIGAGTYADDDACGVSCTGTGELFIRHAVAHDVVARMLYKKISVSDAAQETIKQLPDEKDGGVGGLIALDKDGRHAFAMSPLSDGMYRGFVTETGEIYVAIFAKEEAKRVEPGAAK